MKFNKKAFNLLTTDEQAALSLQKLHNKSTWQAGEILKKSHYKYLEIKQRAERFFELFSVHYDTYGSLVPQGLEVDRDFQDYLHLTIEKRLAPKPASSKLDIIFKDAPERDEFLIKNIKKLQRSPLVHGQNLLTIIMEFDRYNNFRILPQSIQEPSAFKRRNKTRFKNI